MWKINDPSDRFGDFLWSKFNGFGTQLDLVSNIISYVVTTVWCIFCLIDIWTVYSMARWDPPKQQTSGSTSSLDMDISAPHLTIKDLQITGFVSGKICRMAGHHIFPMKHWRLKIKDFPETESGNFVGKLGNLESFKYFNHFETWSLFNEFSHFCDNFAISLRPISGLSHGDPLCRGEPAFDPVEFTFSLIF